MNEELTINNSWGLKPLNYFLEKDKYLIGEQHSGIEQLVRTYFNPLDSSMGLIQNSKLKT
ncbi:MAG: hypothetical protein ICV63_03705 [Coleofasciculus sp. Co-bin14]|nr:hypothetical protein [Coleofasciculus sp. Co-bin14]